MARRVLAGPGVRRPRAERPWGRPATGRPLETKIRSGVAGSGRLATRNVRGAILDDQATRPGLTEPSRRPLLRRCASW